MKVFLIGRGDNCHIQIEDSRISRQHALLKVYPLGKMEIVDQSTNGTAVNGVRIQPNIPKRVTRGDVVTLAESVRLDWSLVPDPLRGYRIGGIALLAVLGVLLLIFGLRSCRQQAKPVLPDLPATALPENQPATPGVKEPEVNLDELGKKMIDSLRREEKKAARQKKQKEAAKESKEQAPSEQEKETEKPAQEITAGEEGFSGGNPIL